MIGKRPLQIGCHPRAVWAPVLAGLALAAICVTAQAQVSLTTVVELAQQKSPAVRLAQSDVQKAASVLAESRDVFIPSVAFGSGLPAFPEVGFTGSLPTIWSANVQSMVFSMSQFHEIGAAKTGLQAAQFSLKGAKEQVALDASTSYIELDTVASDIDAAKQQQEHAARLVGIEQQRVDAGVDARSQLLEAQLTAAQLRLNRMHLETRADTLAKQLSALTGLPAASIAPDHASIPEIPAVSGGDASLSTPAMEAAFAMAHAKEQIAEGDKEKFWTPEIAFGIIYNRNTTLLNEVNKYYATYLPANNLSSGFSINLPIFNATARAKSRESAADALRARVEAEQAKHQYDLQVATLSLSLRELETQAEIATLKQQIAGEQLNTVMAQLELGNGAGSAPGAPAQLSPQAEQQARIDERQKYVDALDAGLELSKTRLSLLRALGHMQDWLDELHAK